MGLDIIGPFETATPATPACRYAITLTDYHSKWPELAFASSATTEDVVKFLITVFSHHGNPECIVTDNGTQFTSAVFAEFLKQGDIKHIRTSVYYPASNGAVERFHRALKGCIQTAIQHAQPWNRAVTEWLQVYRATPHATTAYHHMSYCMGGRCEPSLTSYLCIVGEKVILLLSVQMWKRNRIKWNNTQIANAALALLSLIWEAEWG